MGKAVFEQLLAHLAGLAAPDDAKQRFAELIRQSAACKGLMGSIGRRGCSSPVAYWISRSPASDP